MSILNSHPTNSIRQHSFVNNANFFNVTFCIQFHPPPILVRSHFVSTTPMCRPQHEKLQHARVFNEGTALVTSQLKCLLQNFWCGLLKPLVENFAIIFWCPLILPHFCNCDMLGPPCGFKWTGALQGVFHIRHICIQQNLAYHQFNG